MGWLDDRVSDLRGVLADVQNIDFWPPWDAAETLVNLVARAVEIATSPPAPDPDDVRDAASAMTDARTRHQHVATVSVSQPVAD